jgi:four helix bundle protein
MGQSADESGEACRRQFDLGERTARFGETAIQFARALRLDAVTSPLVEQLVRAATSVGANYGEADEAGSKKEFRYRISLCRREARECKHWLRMIATAAPQSKEDARRVWKEANELTLIFAAIHRKS